ncbi:YcbK family protein [Amylibacter sp. SFDW26]|uniref:YcbK family protein n=1 Tax=Amylibacter sp. SFDW26 TaxID=2652722 RepID=UPI0012623A65|nr:DUF882 domain-containing protein [Amylibacter sp. SFDW26]KAB7615597.1 YcbK family protein [Amylibacter sp. SFDW26]
MYQRRTFITALAAQSLVLATPAVAREKPTLALERQRTGEKFQCEFGRRGIKDKDLKSLNWILRDVSAGEVKFMDLELYEVLARIQAQFSGAPLMIKSGYRTRKTNSAIRGAARKSKHVEGRAVDFTIRGVKTFDLVKVAQANGAGGVGYYPRRGFIHVDTGQERYWRR